MAKQDYINFNGNLYLRSEVNLGLNRAMRFGDGVFETIRIINGEMLWWNEHFDRLLKGLKYLSIDIPKLFIDELLVDCLATIHRNQILEGGVLRVFVYRKGAGGYTPTNYGFDYVIESEPLKENQFKLNKKGLVIGTSNEVQVSSNESQNFKTLNKIPYIRAAAEKVKKGWDEILILNEKGHIAEASSSNIFLLIDEVFYTPRISDGILSGITRKKIIEYLRESNYQVKETQIETKMLFKAQELILCNSVSGVRWIAAYNKSRYFHKVSNSIISHINNMINE